MSSAVLSQIIKQEVHHLTERIHGWRISAGENASHCCIQ